MTGLRLGYVAAKDPKLREREEEGAFYTASNIASVVRRRRCARRITASIGEFRAAAHRDLFYAGVRDHAAGILSGEPLKGRFMRSCESIPRCA